MAFNFLIGDGLRDAAASIHPPLNAVVTCRTNPGSARIGAAGAQRHGWRQSWHNEVSRQTEMAKIRVAQVGCGNRGNVHIEGWLGQPERFEVVALCELDAARMRSTVDELGLDVAQYADADRMLARDPSRPVLFRHSARHTVGDGGAGSEARGERSGVRETDGPVVGRGAAHRRSLRGAGIKATVCQQHIYTSSFQQLKRDRAGRRRHRAADGDSRVHHRQPVRPRHPLHPLPIARSGPAALRSRSGWWATSTAAPAELQDSHPSPDLCLVRLELAGGVYGLGEYGGVAPRYDSGGRLAGESAHRARHRRYGVGRELRHLGNTEPRHRRRAGVRGESRLLQRESGRRLGLESPRIQQGYAGQIADWLQGSLPDHPCNVEHAYTGFEVLAAACYSSMEQVRVDLPEELADPAALTRDGADVFQRLHTDLPTTPLLRPLS